MRAFDFCSCGGGRLPAFFLPTREDDDEDERAEGFVSEEDLSLPLALPLAPFVGAIFGRWMSGFGEAALDLLEGGRSRDG